MTTKPLAVLLIGLGLLVFLNTLNNSFHYDDFPQIVHNQAIKDAHPVKAIWDTFPSRFTAFFSFAFNYHWGGLDVRGFHALNIALHIANAFLVWRLASLLIAPGLVSFFAAAIFLTHPAQTEAVNYIFQRSVVIATFFYLATLVFYIQARRIQTDHEGKGPWIVFYITALVMAALAMISKEMTCSLPFVILLVECLFIKSTKSRWMWVLPFFVGLLIIPLTTIRSLKFWEMPKAAQSVNNSGVTVAQYFMTQLNVKMIYLRLLFLPIKQSVIYDYPAIAKSLFEWPVMASAVVVAGLLGLGIILRRIFVPACFAILWFLITTFPESSFIPINNLVCEYRLYLPMVGFAVLLSALIFKIVEQKSGLAIRLLSVVVIIFSVLSFQRNKVWANEFTLWDDAVKKAPQNQMGYLNRGAYFHNIGNLEAAMDDYNMVVGLGPITAVTLSNRGGIFKAWGQYDLALANFDLAMQINPSYAGTYINRASTYALLGKYDLAFKDIIKAEAFLPQDQEVKALKAQIQQQFDK
jgi:protein O-mannosyl-transferase